MLKNEKTILRMTLKERVKFLTSNVLYKTSKIDDYDFPTLEFVDNPVEREKIKATEFCSLKFLASTWNEELIKNVYGCKANESNNLTKYGYFGLFGNDTISLCPFFNGKFVTNAIKGIQAAKGNACLINVDKNPNEIENNENTIMPYQMAASSCNPNIILVTNSKHIKTYKEKYNYKNLFFGKAKSAKEVLQFFANGCSYVFLDGEFEEDIAEYIEERVERYKETNNAFKNHKLSNLDFYKLVSDGEILDEELINNACDNILELLDNLNQINDNAVPVDFNVHNNLMKLAASEGVILLKNEGNALPINSSIKVGVVGDFASNANYHKDIEKVTTSFFELPLDIINRYDEINKVGFAHGYLKEQDNLVPELVEEAKKIANLSDVLIVYLYADDSIPKNQVELLKEIKTNAPNTKIVGVLYANQKVDLEIEQYVDSLLYTYPAGQAINQAIIDIIVGNTNPSGKLIEELTAGNKTYPFGYGLSYSTFNYSHFICDGEGIRFTITNTSNISGYATSQLYVTKKDAKTLFSSLQLRGFSKDYIQAHETIQVAIPFNDMTFRNWNSEHKCYEVEGGNYDLLVGESKESIKLSGTISLKHILFDEDLFRNEKVIEEVNNTDFMETDTTKEYKLNKKGGLSFKAKMIILSLLLVYFDALGIILFVSSESVGFRVFMFILGVIYTAILVSRILYVIRHRTKEVEINPNDNLTQFVEKVNLFEEEAKLVFDIPLEKEEEVEEEVIEDITEEEQKVKNYLAQFRQSNNEGHALIKEGISIHEICQSFTNYAAGRKVIIEPASCRSIISALASSKMVFIDTKTKDVLSDFLHILNDFFGVDFQIQHASDSWDKFEDLAWEEENDEFVISDFINTVNEANNNPKKFHIAILDNVNMDNFDKYFHNFILFANNPSLDRAIKINDDLQLKLPRNICYLIIPQDDTFIDKMDRQIADASISLDIVMRFATEKDDTTEKEAIAFSYSEFVDSVDDARKTFFLSEDVWKKIDDFEHYVSSKEHFKLGNKNTLCLEKYTSVFIECGGDEQEAFDNAFSQKVVPIIKTTYQYNQENGVKTCVGMIEKIFGNEGITKILRAINKKD